MDGSVSSVEENAVIH